jgi:hypothetical protein
MRHSRLPKYAFLLVAVVCALMSVAAAQKPNKPSPPLEPPGQTKIITDAAGRAHVRHTPIKDAHRKEVAQRMKAARIAAAKKGK